MPKSLSKKICFVVSNPMTVNAFLNLHIKYLSAFFHIHVVANLNQGAILNSKNIRTIKHIPIYRSIHPIKDLIALFRLFIYFREMKFDAVHSITPKAGLLCMLASALVSTPIRIHIFTGQVWHTKTGLRKWLLKKLDKILVSLSTNLLVDSYAQRDFLINENVLNNNNSLVLGKGSISGVSSSKFSANLETRLLLRNKYQISEADLVYAFLGRLNKDKGIKELIDAFTQLKKIHPNIKLLLIGPEEEVISSKIDSSIINHIIFIGHTTKPEDYLQMADVFCMPSHREGFGTSVIEASMLGLPVICSNTYGLKDAFIENRTGLMHKAGDSQDLFICMQKIYLMEEERLVQGQNAKNFALENFNEETISHQWLIYYLNLFTT